MNQTTPPIPGRQPGQMEASPAPGLPDAMMAYAEVAGLPPVVGLWAIIGPLGVYALLGSSRQLSIGPESTTALMTAVVLMPIAVGDPLRYAALASTLALLVGGLCLLGRSARLGFLADLLSKPVLVGYMAGVAVIMISGQLGKITGVKVDGVEFVPQIASFLGRLDQLHWPTVILASALVVSLFTLQRLVPRLPGPLITIVLASAVVALFSLQDHGIPVVETVPVGLPTPAVPALGFADLSALFVPAIGGPFPLLRLGGVILAWFVLAVWWVAAMTAALLLPALLVVGGMSLLVALGHGWLGHRTGRGGERNAFGAALAVTVHAFLIHIVVRPELGIPPWPWLGVLAVVDLAIATASIAVRHGVPHLAAIVASQVLLLLWGTAASAAPWPLVGTRTL